MATQPNFDAGIHIQDVIDLATDVYQGELSLDTVTRGLWLAGCISAKFDNLPDVPDPVGNDDIQAYAEAVAKEAEKDKEKGVIGGIVLQLVLMLVRKLLDEWVNNKSK